MRIYVACLAAYNAGRLHGAWIDASSDVDEMQEAIDAMLKASPAPGAEEWAIHDYEDLPDLGEYPGLERVADVVEFFEEHSDDYSEALLTALLMDTGGDIKDAESWLDNYCGTYETFKDYAVEAADKRLSYYELPDFVSNYFDYDAYARDLSMDRHTIEYSEGVAVFHT